MRALALASLLSSSSVFGSAVRGGWTPGHPSTPRGYGHHPLLAAAVAPPLPAAHACLWTSPTSGLTWDLSPFSAHGELFHLASGSATAAHPDEVHRDAHKFRYSFSICRGVPAPPATCGHHFPGAAAGEAAAIQEDPWGNCWVLGSTKAVAFAEADPHHPGRGIDVTYSGGSPCTDGRPRELHVHFLCAPHHGVEVAPKYAVET